MPRSFTMSFCSAKLYIVHMIGTVCEPQGIIAVSVVGIVGCAKHVLAPNIEFSRAGI